MNKYQFFAQKKATPVAKIIAQMMHKKLFKLFLKHFHDSGKKILEIGPGLGRFSALLNTIPKINYKGFEPESILCQNLREQGLEIVQNTVPPIPEKDDTFDAIVMLNVLEHMKGLMEAQHIAAELYRALAPNGIAFVAFPNFLDWKREFFNLDYTHSYITTEINAKQLFTDAGFTVEYCGYNYGCFFSDFGRFPNLIVRIASRVLQLILPRKLGRMEKIQKMGVLFAENINLVARKKIQAVL
jgi:SAM-dependent methyltransferase